MAFDVTEVTGVIRGLRFRHAGVSLRAAPPPRGRRSCPPRSSRRRDARARMPSATSRRRAKAASGSAPRGATAMTPAQPQRGRAHGTASASSGRVLRATPPPSADRRVSPVEVDLQQHRRAVGPAACAPRSRALTRLGAVDRLHDVGVGGDVAGLVGLQLPDEVQHEVRRARLASACRTCGELLPRLLVAVLAEVPARRARGAGATSDGREELRDDDEGDLVGSRPASAQAALDPGVHGAPAQSASSSRRRAGSLAHRGASRRSMITTPAKRPVTPSRR